MASFSITSSLTRLARPIALLIVVALAATSCGGTDSTEAGAASVTSTTSFESAPDAAVVEAWVVELSDRWAQAGEDRASLFWDDFNADIQIDDTIAPYLKHIRGEAALFEEWAEFLATAPPGIEGEDTLVAFLEDTQTAVLGLRGLADEMEANPAFEGFFPDDDDLPAFEAFQQDWRLAGEAVLQACFPFQEAMVERDLPLIDCAGTSDEPAAPIPQPGGETVIPVDFSDEVEAGTYELDQFTRPFSIELTQPARVESFTNDVGVQPIGDWEHIEYYGFWIVAPDDLPVPGTPYGPIGDTVPFPDDLGSWLEESEIPILSEGTTETGGGPAPYWTVEVPDNGHVVFADFAGSPILYPIRGRSTVWQVPHPAGPFVVIAPEKFEIPGAPGIDEMTAFLDPIIATITPIEGSGNAPPTTVPAGPEPQTDGDVATVLDAILNVEGANVSFMPFEPPFDQAVIACGEPEFSSFIPLAAPVTFVGFGEGEFDLFEFATEADRDAHFNAIEDGAIPCESQPGEAEAREAAAEAGEEFTIPAIETDLIEAQRGTRLVFTRVFNEPEGTFTEFVIVRPVGATGVLSTRAATLEDVEAALAEIGLD